MFNKYVSRFWWVLTPLSKIQDYDTVKKNKLISNDIYDTITIVKKKII